MFIDENEDPIDFTGYTANSQIRKSYTSNTQYTITVNLANTGIATLSMTANATANIAAGRYVYDLEVANTSGARIRYVEGIATVTPEVTR